MILRYVEKKVRLDEREYTVVLPQDIGGFVNREYIMDADRAALNSLLLSMAVLMERREVIIYFPLWKNKPASDLYMEETSEKRYENFDVVFLSHTLQFPACDWKKLRLRMRKIKGEYHTRDINIIDFEKRAHWICKAYEKREACYKKLDLLDRRFRFDTLIFIGGPYSFARSFIELKELISLPLESNYISSFYQNWISLPERRWSRKRYEDTIEIGFYDRGLVKDHKAAMFEDEKRERERFERMLDEIRRKRG